MNNPLNRNRRPGWLAGIFLTVALAAPAALQAEPVVKDGDLPMPLIERFENFGSKDGIPTHKVHAVYKTRDGHLWIGTWDGLCVREADGKFKRYGPEDGLSHKMVLCLTEDPTTGDLWVATMRGLNKFSGGKFTQYTQTNSGLPNNVVYGCDVLDDMVVVATAAGAGILNLKTGQWRIFDHTNSLMHEPWCYAVKGAKDLIYWGVWGAGVLEYDFKKNTWKEYRDPDRDFHYDLVPDDGLINDITSWLSWEDGILWQNTYFGMTRYDGRRFKTWVQDKSPLLSNFTQFVWPHRRVAWIGMDKGVSVTDGEVWVNYEVGTDGEGIRTLHQPGAQPEKTVMNTALANRFVLGIYVDDEEAWFATSDGLSRGVYATPNPYKKLPGIAAAR